MLHYLQTMLQHPIVLPEPNENIHFLLGYIRFLVFFVQQTTIYNYENVFTFLLLLFSLLCNGQSPKLFTTDKELSSSLINQIYQDRNGFIWIATEDGLNRYDGAKFTIYKHEPNNEHSLAHNFVRTVLRTAKVICLSVHIWEFKCMIRPQTILPHLQ